MPVEDATGLHRGYAHVECYKNDQKHSWMPPACTVEVHADGNVSEHSTGQARGIKLFLPSWVVAASVKSTTGQARGIKLFLPSWVVAASVKSTTGQARGIKLFLPSWVVAASVK